MHCHNKWKTVNAVPTYFVTVILCHCCAVGGGTDIILSILLCHTTACRAP